jgi:uncharacterized protein (TIGR00251 family)
MTATLSIKVVPGASRDRIAGKLGDAIKVQVCAAPERGKANDAVINLIAGLLGLRRNEIEIVRGHTQPRKVLQINGIDQQALDQRISELL